jgi:hypothetical protein
MGSSSGGPAAAVQLDLFGEVAALLYTTHAEADDLPSRRQRLAIFRTIKHRHPRTGEHLGDRMWCGRCGAVELNEVLMVINHETGWCAGCYTRFRSGVLASPFAHLTERQRADRWDRRFFTDCVGCGHPWGLHAWDIGGGSHDANAGCHPLLRRSCRCTRYAPGTLPW